VVSFKYCDRGILQVITTEQLQQLCCDDTIVMTQHLTLRCSERGIGFDDIKLTIQHGEIIEQYPSDYPYPSCLMVYQLGNDRFLHIVVGFGDNRLWVITSYYPSEAEWESNFTTRKAGV